MKIRVPNSASFLLTGMLRRLCTALVAVAFVTFLSLRAHTEEINPLRPPPLPRSSNDDIASAAFQGQPPAELHVAPEDVAGPAAIPAEKTPSAPTLAPVAPGVSIPPPGLMHKQEELLPPTPIELTWFHYFSRSWSSH